jgi:hypothetical protein
MNLILEYVHVAKCYIELRERTGIIKSFHCNSAFSSVKNGPKIVENNIFYILAGRSC